MNGFKLIAIDLDGTLLNDNHEISLLNKMAIRKVLNRGIQVTLVTGRVYKSAVYYAEELGLDSFLVLCNGALIKNREAEVLYASRLDMALTGKLLEFAERNRVYIKVYIDDTLFIKEETEEARNFSKVHRIQYKAVGDLSAYIEKEPDLIVFKGLSENITKLSKELRTEFGENISITQSFPTSLELMARHVSKREALIRLAEYLGVKREEVLAIGNSLNDLEMLEWAGQGVAMSNSYPLLKNRWHTVSRYDNNHDGVAHILEEYSLNRKLRLCYN
jgi:Cof subfamily protein (haloacid dehalogenase superfamily)